jgi:hypothetical protein
MARKKAKAQSIRTSGPTSNFLSGGMTDLLDEVKTARLLNQILIPLLAQALELQYLTGRARQPSFRLKPSLDKAFLLARAGLSDAAIQDIDAAKKRLKALDSAVQAVRDLLEDDMLPRLAPDEMLLTVRGKKERIDKVGTAAGPLFGAGFLIPFTNNPDDPPIRLPPVGGAVEAWCKIVKAPYAKKGFIEAGFQVTTATGAAHPTTGLKPVELKVTRALPDIQDNYKFGADTAGRIAALTLCGAGVTQLNANNDAYSGDPGEEMRVMCDKRYFDDATTGFWYAKSEDAPKGKPGFTVSKA